MPSIFDGTRRFVLTDTSGRDRTFVGNYNDARTKAADTGAALSGTGEFSHVMQTARDVRNEERHAKSGGRWVPREWVY